MSVHFHITCFDWLCVLIVEHEVWKALNHKELLHAVNLRKMQTDSSLQKIRDNVQML